MARLFDQARATALEALRQAYIRQMQAAEDNRKHASIRANGATSSASLLADRTYAAAVKAAETARDAIILPAEAEFTAATAAALAAYAAATDDAQKLCAHRCAVADEIFSQKRTAAEETRKLEIAFAQEILEVSVDGCPGIDVSQDAARATFREAKSAAEAKYAAAVSEAEAAKRAEYSVAQDARDAIVRPARDEYEAAINPHAEAKFTVTVPAQQQFSTTFDAAFNAREAAKKAANQKNGESFAAINEAFTNNRRARVTAWLKLVAAFEEFCAVPIECDSQRENGEG
jgi:hypothetical protein